MSAGPQANQSFPLSVDLTLEVPFHDVDSQQIVWHGHYLKYFELARTELFKKSGALRGLRDGGYSWVVIESKCRHVAPLVFAQTFVVRACLLDVDYRVNVGYQIEDARSGTKIAKGHTMLATLDAQKRLLLETPADLLKYLRGPEATC
jgi:acyl-CoA thioester hydrolase